MKLIIKSKSTPNIISDRLAEDSGSTSNRVHPSVFLMAVEMASITSFLTPSEKLGTHSTRASFPDAILN